MTIYHFKTRQAKTAKASRPVGCGEVRRSWRRAATALQKGSPEKIQADIESGRTALSQLLGGIRHVPSRIQVEVIVNVVTRNIVLGDRDKESRDLYCDALMVVDRAYPNLSQKVVTELKEKVAGSPVEETVDILARHLGHSLKPKESEQITVREPKPVKAKPAKFTKDEEIARSVEALELLVARWNETFAVGLQADTLVRAMKHCLAKGAVHQEHVASYIRALALIEKVFPGRASETIRELYGAGGDIGERLFVAQVDLEWSTAVAGLSPGPIKQTARPGL